MPCSAHPAHSDAASRALIILAASRVGPAMQAVIILSRDSSDDSRTGVRFWPCNVRWSNRPFEDCLTVTLAAGAVDQVEKIIDHARLDRPWTVESPLIVKCQHRSRH